jgi:hypothetical protein
LLTDVSIPSDNHALKKDDEEILKQKDLLIEVQHVECESEGDASNHKWDRNPIKIIPELFRRHPW